MKIILVFLLVMSAMGCKQNPAVNSVSGEAMGASWSVEYVDTESAAPPEQLKTEIMSRLQQVEKTFSAANASSDISRFNATAHSNPVKLSEEVSETVRMVKMVSELSGGCYDVADKRLYDLWGFTEDSVNPPSAGEIEQALKHVDSQNIIAYGDFLRKTDAGINIDLSAIMLSLGTEAVVDILENMEITSYMIKVGSNVVYAGAKPDGAAWDGRFAVSLPEAKTIEKEIELLPGPAIVTATIERYLRADDGTAYNPVLDARTGKPVTHNTVAVTVNHTDPARGMAWAKALLCLGNEEGMTVATRSDIKALFFTNKNGQVVEQMSPALANAQSTQ